MLHRRASLERTQAAPPDHPDPSDPPPLRSSRWTRRVRFVGRRFARSLRGHDRGATTLEWALLLAAIALPSYFIIRLGLALLFTHYRLVTTINGLPFP